MFSFLQQWGPLALLAVAIYSNMKRPAIPTAADWAKCGFAICAQLAVEYFLYGRASSTYALQIGDVQVSLDLQWLFLTMTVALALIGFLAPSNGIWRWSLALVAVVVIVLDFILNSTSVSSAWRRLADEWRASSSF